MTSPQGTKPYRTGFRFGERARTYRRLDIRGDDYRNACVLEIQTSSPAIDVTTIA